MAPCRSHPDLGRELAGDQDWCHGGAADLVRMSAVRSRNGLPRSHRWLARRADAAVAVRLETHRRLGCSAHGYVLGANGRGVDVPAAWAFIGAGILDAALGGAAVGVVVA